MCADLCGANSATERPSESSASSRSSSLAIVAASDGGRKTLRATGTAERSKLEGPRASQEFPTRDVAARESCDRQAHWRLPIILEKLLR
jgi:hypothetical protein